MKNLSVLSICAVAFFSFYTVQAQDTHKAGHQVRVKVPKVALLDIESNGSKTITLAPTAPEEAGEFLDFSKANNDDLWVNYSSVIGNKGKRKVVVAITDGKVPGGMELFVRADNAQGGKGALGQGSGRVKLTRTPAEVIKNIGSSYTEDGARKGHKLNYELRLGKDANSVKQLNFDDANTLTITYTLTDN